MMTEKEIEIMRAELQNEKDTTQWLDHKRTLLHCICILDKVLGD